VPYLRATLSYARPFLAADEEAEQLYQAALSSDMSNWPCYRGRLRQLRQLASPPAGVAESRAPLRTALKSFDALPLTVRSLPGQDRVLPANQRGRVVRCPGRPNASGRSPDYGVIPAPSGTCALLRHAEESPAPATASMRHADEDPLSWAPMATFSGS
jgi:hypothetical protein